MSALLEAFARQVRDRRHEPALWSRAEGLRLTFGDVAERIEEWRGALAAKAALRNGAGASAAAPVALATGNCAAFVTLFFALRALDLPVVAMDGALPLQARLELCRRLGIAALLHRDLTSEIG